MALPEQGKKACDCRLFCVPLQGGFVWELFDAAFSQRPISAHFLPETQ